MSINVNWADETHHAVQLTFHPGWTWQGLYAAITAADGLIGSVAHRVDLLIDLRQAGRLPGDFMQMAGDVFASGEARSNEGRRIVIGAGPILRAAYGAFLRLNRKAAERPLIFAASLSDAQAVLDGR
jgi:hypothetical protein